MSIAAAVRASFQGNRSAMRVGRSGDARDREWGSRVEVVELRCDPGRLVSSRVAMRFGRRIDARLAQAPWTNCWDRAVEMKTLLVGLVSALLGLIVVWGLMMLFRPETGIENGLVVLEIAFLLGGVVGGLWWRRLHKLN